VSAARLISLIFQKKRMLLNTKGNRNIILSMVVKYSK